MSRLPRTVLLGIALPRGDEIATAFVTRVESVAARFVRWFGGDDDERVRPDPRPLHHRPQVVLGLLLAVGGLIAFSSLQTQQLFKDSLETAISEGLVPRNDGGLLFGALVAALGIALMLASLSPRSARRRILPILGLVSSVAGILFLHFTIFVNSFVVPDGGLVMLRASFMFHDDAGFIPMAVFAVALVTMLLVLLGAASLMALIAPRLLRDHFLHPKTADAHRSRLVLAAMLILLVGGTFVHQFVHYALAADAEPTGGFVATNRVALYYLLAFTLLASIATTAWHTTLLVWGDLRERRTLSFQRSIVPLQRTETWLYATTFLLNLIVLLPAPVYTPDPATTSRVFAMNSRGASIFFLLLFGAWAAHRASARSWLTHLRGTHERLPIARGDRLAWMVGITAGVWIVLWALLALGDLSPTPRLLIRLGAIALLLPFFAVRIRLGEHGLQPRLAHHGAPMTLLLFAAIAIVTGLMLWGTANTITTSYSRSGGFVTPEGEALQPYATGIQLLGSLFIALPVMLGLWYLGSRHGRVSHPAPVLVAALATLLAMNMVLTVNTEAAFDAELGQTDVLVGFRIINLATGLDKVILMGAWAGTLLLAIGGAMMVLHRAADKGATPVPRPASVR